MPYRCPQCAGILLAQKKLLSCGTCSNTYPIVNDIPLFSKDRYWGKVPASEMEEALRVIESEGWGVFKQRFEKKLDVAFDESRADWRFEVPLTSDWTVLDCGAGLGRITIPLARVAKHVVAFDQSVLRARFIKHRIAKEQLNNVELFVGDIFDLPLPPKSFDLIALNGVLEWVGKTHRFKDARDAQVAALKICKTLLKDGGFLYIGIENRYSFVYMRQPEHGGLMYTTFMPRWLAHWYNNLRRGESYQTYTHSKREYARLLRDAGFSDTTFYLPYPGYNLPRIVIPYDDLRALRFTILHLLSGRRFGVFGHLLLRTFACVPGALRMYRYFFFSFNIIARV